MSNPKFDFSKALPHLSSHQYEASRALALKGLKNLEDGKGQGREFLGWHKLPIESDHEILDSITELSKKVSSHSDVLVVVGIGGSYLGAKAAIEFMGNHFKNGINSNMEIYFAGINMSSDYLKDLLNVLEGRDFSINIISKSGTTTEPSIAFRILKELCVNKYGVEGSKERIIATTDKEHGALRKLVEASGYESFIIPENVGGRFSVLTPVGLLPMAIAGIDVHKLIEGAKQAYEDCLAADEGNPALQYAAVRNGLYNNGKAIELMCSFEPCFQYLAEWWKQLFGESEGKHGKGIFPASVTYSADLHSMGQYVQDGPRHLFETFINLGNSQVKIDIPIDEENLDGLNYLASKTLNEINLLAKEGTIQAHEEGKVPIIEISIDQRNAFNLGYLFYFFEKACAISAYSLGVNPFDQPGVEAYKRNMFKLLGKPGY